MLKGMYIQDWYDFEKKINQDAELYWKYPLPFIKIEIHTKKAHEHRAEIAEWVSQNCDKDVFVIRLPHDAWNFYFQEENQAAEFKLTWGGE